MRNAWYGRFPITASAMPPRSAVRVLSLTIPACPRSCLTGRGRPPSPACGCPVSPGNMSCGTLVAIEQACSGIGETPNRRLQSATRPQPRLADPVEFRDRRLKSGWEAARARPVLAGRARRWQTARRRGHPPGHGRLGPPRPPEPRTGGGRGCSPASWRISARSRR